MPALCFCNVRAYTLAACNLANPAIALGSHSDILRCLLAGCTQADKVCIAPDASFRAQRVQTAASVAQDFLP